MAKKKIPVVEFEIDENNPLNGVKVISLVSEPAIESDFLYFNKAKEKPVYVELKSDKYKQVVAGLALIPEKKIYRVDAEGNEYYGVFSKETIEKIRKKFAKEKLSDRVNTEHSSEDFIEAYLLDSYIIESEHQLSHVKSLGIEEAVLGSWFVSYQIEDAEVFQKVISGELNGFSVEIFLQRLHKVNNNFNKTESRMSKLVEKFKALLAEFENEKEEESKLESAKAEDGSTVEYSEVGEAVNIIDEEGNASPAPDGEYKLDNGKIVIVASGVATEIKDAGEEEAPAPEEHLKAELESTKTALASAKAEIESLKSQLNEIETEIENFKKKPLAKPVTRSKKVEVEEEVDESKLSNLEKQRRLYNIK